ncbi:hypothetical protein D9756_009816 [Leucocoprinus leucothites]|uniref:Uncharacterized protein n=1 Tax=Leucocoprinus leucothites TaxID=201217 RepID=A0A8H5FTT1_9AGAR|nr:hypothetical protein D9756_009816 [Leucoagaricus leucothites]
MTRTRTRPPLCGQQRSGLHLFRTVKQGITHSRLRLSAHALVKIFKCDAIVIKKAACLDELKATESRPLASDTPISAPTMADRKIHNNRTTSSHVNARQCGREVIETLKRNATAIKQAIASSAKVKTKPYLPAQRSSSGQCRPPNKDGDSIMNYSPPGLSDGNDDRHLHSTLPTLSSQASKTDEDVKMGEPGEGWAEMDIDDEDILMDNVTQESVGTDVTMTRDDTQDYPDTDIVMREGTQNIDTNDVNEDCLDTDIVTKHPEDDPHVNFYPYSWTAYSPTSSTTTLVDEDITMADPGGHRKHISIACLAAMFKAMDLKIKVRLPLIRELCVRLLVF